MILSVMMLGGIMLSGAAIAGLLMLYQIKSANDAVNSAKAIFAADAGLESVTWCILKGAGTSACVDGIVPIVFDDSTVSINAKSQTVGSEIIITSRGYGASGKAVRILETIFETGP
ncbi:MAG: hypothetical protein UY32_C0014G0008 [Candidatus Jorgensenbacteria bacterium GW2011_GWC1_48_8]|nr:MAG: hypothetical protein UY32_C0014G0008 [Candidatus Jorgensenbacteria bacterium GW2011_GWC1_48_8]